MNSPTPPANRVLLGLVLLVVGILAYAHCTALYVSDHQRPLLVGLAFSSPFGWALFYCFRKGDMRGSLLRAIATAHLFLMAMLMAPSLRQAFVATAEELKGIPEVLDYIGSDLATVLLSHTVGYWGCFLATLALSRLFLYRPVLWLVTRLAGTAPGVHRCPMCSQEAPATP